MKSAFIRLPNKIKNKKADVIDLDATTEDAERYAKHLLHKAEKELSVIY